MMVSVHAQLVPDGELPSLRHLTGLVVDEAGQPVAEARIDDTFNDLKAYQTDSKGRFEVDTKSPILVVRKVGYRSELIRVQDATESKITLQALHEKRRFPTCSNQATYTEMKVFLTEFRFVRTSGIELGRRSTDVDYASRAYWVKTKEGPKGVVHGAGPMWSFGIPSDRDVSRSVKYNEVARDADGRMIVDARGQLKDGTWWRTLAIFGESATYRNMDEATAGILDQFLDGACLVSAPR